MPKYVIEREMPGIGKATTQQLQEGSRNSNTVVADLGPEIRWLESYITDDKVYCVYVAPSQDIILEHARCAGLPADRITKVAAVTDPSWGE
jgi:Nickel responsive protein SCO4226-like